MPDLNSPTTRPSDALTSTSPLARVKTLSYQVVREVLDRVIEGLNEDDEVLPTWHKRTVAERLMYITGNLIEELLDDDYDEEEYEEDDDFDDEEHF